MKNGGNCPKRGSSAAFTLIELIGVMAIMAIMASVLVPNVLRSMDRAVVLAEQQTLRNIADQIRKYLQDVGTPPASAPANAWAAEIEDYSQLSYADLVTNKRQMARVYLVDPAGLPGDPRRRAILLSSMRQGMGLPTATNINTDIRFNELWNSPDGTVPSAVSWGGWTAAAADYLVIERINFRSEYHTVILNNRAATGSLPVRYEVRSARGAVLRTNTIGPGADVTLDVANNMRISLYDGQTLPARDYLYLVSGNGKTFRFDGTHWSPQ